MWLLHFAEFEIVELFLLRKRIKKIETVFTTKDLYREDVPDEFNRGN